MKNKNEEININKFILNKDNNSYELIIEKIEDTIYIKCLSYQVKFDKGNISEIFSKNLNNIKDEFDFICNLFINKKVEIYEILFNVNIILSSNFTNESAINNKVYICLIHQEQNQNLIINKYYNKIKQLENNNKKDKNENNNTFLDININKFDLKLIKSFEAFSINPYNNSFIIFNSFCNNIEYLIFADKNQNIISYNLNSNQKLAEIKQSEYIMKFDYIFDKKNKRDLLMIYNLFHFIRIFDIKNWNIILTINENNFGTLKSACFLHYIKDNEYFIISSNDSSTKPTKIKIYDFNGKIKKEIENSNENSFFVKTYYEEKKGKTFIVSVNKKWIKSYDYEKNIIYKKYYEKGIEGYSNLEIIKTKDEVIQLITSCAAYDLILIFNFDTGNLLNKIEMEEKFFTMYLYSEKILFIGTLKGSLILMNLLSQEKKKFEKIHGNFICSINSFTHKKEGKCLVTQANDNIIKIYKIINDDF